MEFDLKIVINELLEALDDEKSIVEKLDNQDSIEYMVKSPSYTGRIFISKTNEKDSGCGVDIKRIKIKNDVNLDILEDFGFKKSNGCWFKKVYMANDNDDRVCYRIDTSDRIINITRLDGELDNTLYKLFSSNLVEEE